MADGYKVLIIGDTSDAAWLEAARCQAKLMYPNDAYWYENEPPPARPATCTDAVTSPDNEYQAALDGDGLSVCSVDSDFAVVEYAP